jgi:Na+-translocating ferredoxin:NAD+ oxidoreductase RnfC subunit
MKEYRRIPLAQLRKRLHIEEYERETPFDPVKLSPAAVRIKMKQHAGQTANPIVGVGANVKKGQTVGRVEEDKLGADVHASIAGKVRSVTAEAVEIVA